MRQPKAILFDLDDTLMVFDGVSAQAWNECCEAFVRANAVDFTPAELLTSIEETKAWYWGDPERSRWGRENMKEARRHVFSYAAAKLGFADEEKNRAAADGYSARQEELWRLFDGIPEALDRLRRRYIRMAVVTNGDSATQRRKLERFHLTPYFDFVLIDTEVGFSKPDERIFQLALDRLGLPARDVWMIGDNLVWDVQGPARLGITAVWNDYEGKGLPVGSSIKPDMIVSSVQELVQCLSFLK